VHPTIYGEKPPSQFRNKIGIKGFFTNSKVNYPSSDFHNLGAKLGVKDQNTILGENYRVPNVM
jgi:hypothetical protein